MNNDPIIAVATASGRGAVGIVRLSGYQLKRFIQFFFGEKLHSRQATLLPFKSRDGQIIDKGLVIYFPAPHSYTGEEVLELQAHGGPVVLQMLVQRCLEAAAEITTDGKPVLAHLRLAEPGEFTQRAFLNDKIDLAQAEAVSDLINASTEIAVKSASRAIEGAFSRQIEMLQLNLTHLRMLIEASIDFPEEDVDFIKRDDAQGQVQHILEHLQRLFSKAKQGALLRNGLNVVIAGQPNAGKSSLLNALAGNEVAIVTAIPGTTRDKVIQQIQIEGIPLHIIDTAGLRQTNDEVERIGIDRAWKEIEHADIIIFLHDLTRLSEKQYQFDEEDLQNRISQLVKQHIPVVNVYNKCDLRSQQELTQKNENSVFLSAKTGEGLEELRTLLLKLMGWQATSEDVFLARTRHLQSLEKTQLHTEQAQQLLNQDEQELDLIAEELRLAQRCLSSITGEFSADDLLGVIFSEFCIGK